MSLDDLPESLASNGRPTASAEAVGMGLCGKYLESLVVESEEIPIDDSELLALLARLDGADTVATGVEAKLDGILGTLDELLTSLEAKHGDSPREDPMSHSESQSERPQPQGQS